jgi:hypothetical protein
MSGQPKMGQPNTNGNTALAPVNANFVGPTDGATNSNPYPNTIGGFTGGKDGQPLGKGGGGNQGGGKGSTATEKNRLVDFPQLVAAPFDPNMGGNQGDASTSMLYNTYHPNQGPQGPGANY